MRILVTGGAGFIGSNFIRYMLKRHPAYKIVNLDKLTYAGNLQNLTDVEGNKNYKFVKGDICDARLVDRLTAGSQVLINFAASTHVDRSITDPEDFLKTNVLGANVLLEAAKKHRPRLFIQISTDEVYGSVAKGYSSEDDNLRPNSPYSASKAAADLLARSYHVTHKVPVIISRSSNNFGPYQYPEKVIPLFITNLMESEKVPLYGAGLNIRDWLYVLDNCRAIDLIMHKGAPGEVYNIGGGNLLSNKELTFKILKLLGKSKDFIEHVKDRPGHDFRYALDCGKLKRLGWKPSFDFEEALAETVTWYRKNTRWWLALKDKKFQRYYKKHYGEKYV
jgi:dTDP-glucose 4,6-dehydratase